MVIPKCIVTVINRLLFPSNPLPARKGALLHPFEQGRRYGGNDKEPEIPPDEDDHSPEKDSKRHVDTPYTFVYPPYKYVIKGTRHAVRERLTPKERETLTLLVDGLTNKEISNALGVKEITVKKRLGKIYRKFGVSKRTQAVRMAMEYEIVP